MKSLAIIILLLAAQSSIADSDSPWQFEVSAELGRCQSSVYLEMCSEDRAVWKVTAATSYELTDNIHAVGSVDHFSSFDGTADLQGDKTQQSGQFNFIGIGLKAVW